MSFLIPLVELLLKRGEESLKESKTNELVAIIIEPTRELAHQVHDVATALFAAVGRSLPPPVLLCGGAEGGKKKKGSVTALIDAAEDEGKKFTVCIATPGKLNSTLSEGILSVKPLELLILDEADRLLDLGFEVTLSAIFDKLPKQRRSGLYSATQTSQVRELAKVGLRDPVRIRVEVDDERANDEASSTPASLTGHYHICAQEDKLLHLLGLIASRPNDKFIVYFLTCAMVDYYRRLNLTAFLAGRDIQAISGRVWQKKRTKIMDAFRTAPNGVLFCTDVASRGLDVPDVDFVVQFDPPQDPKAYIHRVGRTARLGRPGKALLYLTPAEEAYVEFLRVKKCAVEPLDEDVKSKIEPLESEDVRNHAKALMLGDRAVLESAEMAYLSYLRAYKEHHCAYILRFEELDAASLARSLQLLRLPKVSEFKQFRRRIEFEEDQSVDYWGIPFKDEKLEKLRQEKMKTSREEAQKAVKEREKMIREKKRLRPKTRKHTFDRAEMMELEQDARMVKKIKRNRQKHITLDSE